VPLFATHYGRATKIHPALFQWAIPTSLCHECPIAVKYVPNVDEALMNFCTPGLHADTYVRFCDPSPPWQPQFLGSFLGSPKLVASNPSGIALRAGSMGLSCSAGSEYSFHASGIASTRVLTTMYRRLPTLLDRANAAGSGAPSCRAWGSVRFANPFWPVFACV